MAVGPTGLPRVVDRDLFAVYRDDCRAELLAARIFKNELDAAAGDVHRERLVARALLPVVGELGGVDILEVKSITLRTNAKTEMVRLYIEGDMTAKDAK